MSSTADILLNDAHGAIIDEKEILCGLSYFTVGSRLQRL